MNMIFCVTVHFVIFPSWVNVAASAGLRINQTLRTPQICLSTASRQIEDILFLVEN